MTKILLAVVGASLLAAGAAPAADLAPYTKAPAPIAPVLT